MPGEACRLKGQHIYPAIRRCAAKILLHKPREKPVRRAQDTTLLGRCNACRGAAIEARSALPHFYEYQEGPIAHDQVQFAGGTTQLTSQHHAPCALEVCLRKRFVKVSALLLR